MRSLATLRKNAQAATAQRGHRMRWGEPYGNATTQVFSQNAACKKCGRGVTVHMQTAPNQIDIGGEAVAVDCDPRQHVYLVRWKKQGEFDQFAYETDDYWDMTTKKHIATRYDARSAGDMVAQILKRYPLAALEVEHV